VAVRGRRRPRIVVAALRIVVVAALSGLAAACGAAPGAVGGAGSGAGTDQAGPISYSGGITRRNDPQIKALNPNLPLPPLTIVPVHRSDRSGDTFLFTSYLSTQDPGWNASIGYGTTANWPKVAGALSEQGSLAVVHGCAATAGCVAYNGISYRAIGDDQNAFRSAVTKGSGALSPLAPVVLIAALLMALCCAWGLWRRLAEYR
jgi:hypothetical protein